MKRTSKTILVSLCCMAMTACLAEPTSPTYPQPDNDQAEAAYEKAFRKDFLEARPEGQEADKEISLAPVRQAYGMMNSDSSQKALARKRISDTREVEIRVCQWQNIELANIQFHSRWRVRDKVQSAYYCEIEVHQDFHPKGIKSAITSGYFFKSENGYEYAGQTAKGF